MLKEKREIREKEEDKGEKEERKRSMSIVQCENWELEKEIERGR
jgi:hypothetical protein